MPGRVQKGFQNAAVPERGRHKAFQDAVVPGRVQRAFQHGAVPGQVEKAF